MHEGQVLVPQSLPTDVWPVGSDGTQPHPEVLARGTDHEAGTVHDLVVSYDGDIADVGRIVADSTWHHYFNVNLKGFPSGGAVLTQLTQYFLNLAVWLAPAAKRREIACWLRWQVIQDPNVQMSLGNPPRAVGRVSSSVLRRRHGPCAVRDVLALAAAASESLAGPEPPLELMVGNVIDTYVRAMARIDRARDEERHGLSDNETLLSTARVAAFGQFRSELTNALEQLERAAGGAV